MALLLISRGFLFSRFSSSDDDVDDDHLGPSSAGGPGSHLHDVEFGQQVAVGQGECVTVQVLARGHGQVGVQVQLLGVGALQEHVELHQGGEKLPLHH